MQPLDPAPFERILAMVAAHGGTWVSETRPVMQVTVSRADDWRGWTPHGGLRRTDGAWLVTVGSDAALESPPLRLRASDFRYVAVEMRAATEPDAHGAPWAQLFWASADVSGFTEEHSVRWP